MKTVRYILFVISLISATSLVMMAQANIQFIHTAADPELAEIDIWMQIETGNPARINEAVQFNKATGFTVAPFGREVRFYITKKGANKATDSVSSFRFVFENRKNYIAVIRGVAQASGFAPNPNQLPIECTITTLAGIPDNTESDKVSIYGVHSITDAPAVSISVREESRTLFSNISYGQSQKVDTFSVGTVPYTIDLTPIGSPEPIASFGLNLEQYNREVIVLVATGFIEPARNKNGSEFGLIAVRSDGSVLRLPRIFGENIARVAVINASADQNLPSVDVYMDTTLIANDISRLGVSTLLTLPGKSTAKFSINESTSTSNTDKVITTLTTPALDSGKSYFVYFHGLKSTTGYAPSPTSDDISAKLTLVPTRATSTSIGKVQLNAFHAVTDGPEVDVKEREGDIKVDNLRYGGTAPFSDYNLKDYVINLTPGNDNNTSLREYFLPFGIPGYRTIGATVLASGFLDPSKNSNGPSVELYVCFIVGDSVYVEKLPSNSTKFQAIHNSPDPTVSEVDVYLDGEKPTALDNFKFRSATSYLNISPGTHKITIAQPSSTGATDKVIKEFPFYFVPETDVVGIVCGLVDTTGFNNSVNGDNQLSLFIHRGRSKSLSPNSFDMAEFHGSTDLPATDVYVNSTTTPRSPRMTYGAMSLYGSYDGNVIVRTSNAGQPPVSEYQLPVDGLKGSTGIVLLSGFNDPTVNKNGEQLGLLFVTSDGKAQMIDRRPVSVEESITILAENAIAPNPVSTSTVRLTYALTRESSVTLSLYDALGNQVFTSDEGLQAIGNHSTTMNVASLPNGTYTARIFASNSVSTTRFVVLR
jgi:hypothetical protein